MTKTMMVVIMVSRRVGQVTFDASARTSWRNLNGLTFAMLTLVLGHMLHGPPVHIGPVQQPRRIYTQEFRKSPSAGLEGEFKPGRSGGTATS